MAEVDAGGAGAGGAARGDRADGGADDASFDAADRVWGDESAAACLSGGGVDDGRARAGCGGDDLVVRRVSVSEFEEMVLDGVIVDNCSVAAWGLYRVWRERR